MTTMTATLRMLLLLCISLGQIRLVSMQSTVVPIDGVYIITMVADPDGRTDMFLQLNGHDSGFVAYAVEDAVAGLTVGLYLKAGTRVSARFTGDPEAATRLGVGFASHKKSNFVTVRSNGYSSETSEPIPFHHQYTADRAWKNIADTSIFELWDTGMYWVAARIDCSNGRRVSVKVEMLFTVFCHGDKAISASGAFHLKDTEELALYFVNLWKTSNLQSSTTFSLVRLEGNQNQAYTAWADRTGTLSSNEKLSFNTPKTDFGNLYDSTRRTWTIRKTGKYIVSMRGDPNSNTLKVILYKNRNQYVFSWFNEEGTKSGQAGVFQFTEGDTLYMVDVYGRYVGVETFMSIALLWAA